MVYSKLLKLSTSAVCRTFKFKYAPSNVRSSLLNYTTKVSPCRSLIYQSSCQYSTILSSKLSHSSKPSSKCVLPLNCTAFLSTGGNKDTYQIVITNPADGTTSTLNDASLNSVNGVKNSEELLAPTSDLTDIATTLPDQLASITDVIEPSLSSLGLASHWTPVGWIQIFLDYMHVSMHCPWWITIIACTITARIILFPVLLKTQRNAINMSNYMPQLQYLQMKFGEARRSGNNMEASKYASEMLLFMKEKDISPVKNAMWPLLQAPVFLSFFFALRNMAKAPVESMKEGGIYWVTDLTIPDPYYVLPVVACGTLYIVLKVSTLGSMFRHSFVFFVVLCCMSNLIGAESGIKMENMKLAKYFLQALPLIALPFCANFPSAVLYYWVSNNFCTLAIVSILKIQPVRKYFNMPTQQPIDPKFIQPKKGFMSGMKEAFEDQKVLANIEDRRRMDDITFQKAGTGPIPRTYSYDPTKPRPSNVASITGKNIAAKDRKI